MKHVNIRRVKQGTAELAELYLENGLTGGRLLCPQSLIPTPGQYMLAHDPGFNAPLAAPIFSAGLVPGGFLIAPPITKSWQPGTLLALRGPLGNGFSLPDTVNRVALVALGDTFARLKPLLKPALNRNVSVVVVSNLILPDLPPEVELQPVSTLPDIAKWADYSALDLPRDSLSEIRAMMELGEQARLSFEAQALVNVPMVCGGLADCGVCAVKVHREWKFACKDGPVFDLNDLI